MRLGVGASINTGFMVYHDFPLIGVYRILAMGFWYI